MAIFGVPLLDTLCFYVAILGLKMLVMSLLTARQRFSKKAFANPEDAKGMGRVKLDDDVERVRRAHLNDLENIPVFVIVCTVYLLTSPSLSLAANLIRIFALARIVHTLAYAIFASHKVRGMAWGIGYFITVYMAVMSLKHFMSFM
ncbi:microsomal glutathione S-transferase 1-like [Arctopsyche grandis]|uniref:microsomal glutathione S-transferase 1-like n=1 Tax=Arctopsyche grandis TaxID=121162 RepID=UPI00406D958E